MAGQSEERVRDLHGVAARLREDLRHTAREHGAHAVDADVRVVGGPQCRLGDELPVLQQREAGLGSSAVDAEEEAGGHITPIYLTNG
jgi:hypothetical protein